MPADTFAPSAAGPADQAVPAHRRRRLEELSLDGALVRARALLAAPLLWLLIATLAVRIVGIDRPLVSTFATKSAVHAMVARNWALGRAPLWRPTIDQLHDGVRAWHLMEWPAAAYAAGFGWKLCGGSLDAWGRGISIACSLVSVWLVYRLGNRWFGLRAAQGAAFVFAFSPVSIIYGQSFLLEASLAALLLTTLAAFDAWLETRRVIWLAVAAVAAALAIITKIYMLVLFVPLAAMLLRNARQRAEESNRSALRGAVPYAVVAVVAFAVALLPVAAWYGWVFSLSPTEGPQADYHPLSRASIHGFPHPLLFSAAYYQRLALDFATVVLTPLGVLLALCGIADIRFRRMLPLSAALLALVVAFPLKFMAANYYYVVLLPALALAAGLGWQRLVETKRLGPLTTTALAALSLLIAARYTIGPAYRTPAEDRGVIAAAAAVRETTAAEEPVATMHGSTLDLLYYCDRPGHAFDVADPHLAEKFDAARASGARMLIVAGLDSVGKQPTTTELLTRLPIVRSGDDWRLYSLELPTSR